LLSSYYYEYYCQVLGGVMTLDDVLDKIEAIIDSTHSVVSPLKMEHCKYCTTWLTLTEGKL
jgi:hypothetical protein